MPEKASRANDSLSRSSLAQAILDAHDEAQRISDELSSMMDMIDKYPCLLYTSPSPRD